ncbi:MAG TPA: class I SAM-dependent methyltransferase [Gaiellaceae bacterium]|nr:class I SAM-dependent methyltransferase [Gaiellaceae bacterium]
MIGKDGSRPTSDGLRPRGFGARRSFAGVSLDPKAAFDYISSFRYGNVYVGPIQIREETVEFMHRIAEAPPRRVLEIGTGLGGTLFLFARVAAPDATLMTVEQQRPLGYPRTYAPLLKSFARDRHTIHLVRADSHDPETLERIRSHFGGSIDLLFIDGDHTYDGVRFDHELYGPLVRSGGLIAFHDIMPGPYEAVGEVARYRQEIGGDGEEMVADYSQQGCGIGLLRV